MEKYAPAHNLTFEEAMDKFRAEAGINRYGQPEEIANLMAAWHEVPGKAPPQKSRPGGYGVIRAGVRADSMIGLRFRKRSITSSSSSNIIGHESFKKSS
jgi:hypothetical protein